MAAGGIGDIVMSDSRSEELSSNKLCDQEERNNTSEDEYDTSMDIELFQDPQVLKDFIDGDSSCSSDSKLQAGSETGLASKVEVASAHEPTADIGASGNKVDMELLQDPEVLRNFIDDDSSSDDIELPRVNITGTAVRGSSTASREKAAVEKCPVCDTAFPTG